MNSSATVGAAIRRADAPMLAQALCDSRRDTLARFAQGQASDGAALPLRTELNPALWELGHIGWFQTWWLARNPQRDLGPRADPQAPRPHEPGDALYDSSRVPHDSRWQLALPHAQASRQQLDSQLQQTLALLDQAPAGDDALYFFRLALLHEDMHHEAALTMAQSLGWAMDDPRWLPLPLSAAHAELAFDAAPWPLGWQGPGFAFDNELAAHPHPLPATRIASRVVRWAEYLPFVEAGGYARANQARCWSEAGQAWLASQRESGRNEHAAQTMRHEHGRFVMRNIARQQHVFQPGNPVATQRPDPVMLLHALVAVRALPAALPVAGATALPAGKNQDVARVHAL